MKTTELPPNIESGFRVKYAVDLVLCIDGTSSMSPVIETVKRSALDFHEQLLTKMQNKGKHVDQLRIKVIVFRDYWADSPDIAMVCSPFFDMATDNNDFAAFVLNIEAVGGGDPPENGLEALALAIQSDWFDSSDFPKKRHVIVLWTDTNTHPLERPGKPDHYPAEVPLDYNGLYEEWEHVMPSNSKRMVLFAPEIAPWTDLSEEWDDVTHVLSIAGQGLDELNLNRILDDISSSI